MHDLIKIESMNGMARDISSHAVISTSPEVFEDYHRRKMIASQKNSIIEKQQEEITALKADLAEIKQMLQALTKR